jgi:hypothetical protein
VRISPGFLSAMGTRLLEGRDFTDRDTQTAPAVALVNQAFAARFFPGRDPIGQRFFERGGSRSGEPMEIVGVVENAKWLDLRHDVAAMYYRPYRQMAGSPAVRFVIRTSGAFGLELVAANLRAAARAIQPRLALTNIVPFDEIVDRTMSVERLLARVSAACGLLALIVGAIGLYGVVAFGVARRRREIGVRIAVGASSASIEWLVLRESLLLLAAGLVVGLPVALAATRLVSARLFGLSPRDPTTLALVLAILTMTTAAASHLPARRAARLDPLTVLREE